MKKKEFKSYALTKELSHCSNKGKDYGYQKFHIL